MNIPKPTKATIYLDNLQCQCFNIPTSNHSLFLQKPKPSIPLRIQTKNQHILQFSKQSSIKNLGKKSLRRHHSPQIQTQTRFSKGNFVDNTPLTPTYLARSNFRKIQQQFIATPNSLQNEESTFSNLNINDKYYKIINRQDQSTPSAPQTPVKPKIRFNMISSCQSIKLSPTVIKVQDIVKDAVKNQIQQKLIIRKATSQKPNYERTSLKNRKQSFTIPNTNKSQKSTLCKQSQSQLSLKNNTQIPIHKDPFLNFTFNNFTQSSNIEDIIKNQQVQKSIINTQKSMVNQTSYSKILKKHNPKIISKMADVEELRSMADSEQMGWSDEESVVIERMNSLVDPTLQQNLVLESKMVSDKTFTSFNCPSRLP